MTAQLASVLKHFYLYFGDAVEWFRLYFADSFYPVLFILSLGLIAVHPDAKKERTVLIGTNILFVLLIFCPVSAWVFQKMIGSLVYWRLFWMLTLPIVIAYAGVQLISGFSGKGLRMLTGLAAAFAIIFSGQFLFTGEYFTGRLNFFKIPTEAIYVAEIISSHSEENGIESPKAAVTSFLSTYIRQYDAGIRLAYGRNMAKDAETPSKLYTEINSEAPKAKRLARLVRKAECQYLVLPASLEMEEDLSEYDFIKIDEAAEYVVYFDVEETT